MNESELLDRIRRQPGDFSELFRLYYKPIFGYILRRTGDFDQTADITAETFLKAFKYIDKFTYRGVSVKVWLYRIATNEMNLLFRFKRRYNTLFERSDFADREKFNNYMKEDREELEEELQKHDQFMEVLREMKTLPVKYQEVISLKYFEGKENKEIAAILNKKEGTVKSLLSRGVKKLSEKCNRIEH